MIITTVRCQTTEERERLESILQDSGIPNRLPIRRWGSWIEIRAEMNPDFPGIYIGHGENEPRRMYRHITYARSSYNSIWKGYHMSVDTFLRARAKNLQLNLYPGLNPMAS